MKKQGYRNKNKVDAVYVTRQYYIEWKYSVKNKLFVRESEEMRDLKYAKVKCMNESNCLEYITWNRYQNTVESQLINFICSSSWFIKQFVGELKQYFPLKLMKIK